MTTERRILGIHHVSAIASDPQRNLDFYAGVLALRLVKRTVNFDDPQTYHLYYGDETGTPGTLMTFFPWPGARAGRAGVGQLAVTSFAIAPGAVGFWVERLLRHGVAYQQPSRRGAGADAEQVIAFRDHDGLMLELVAHPAVEARPSWGGAPGVPAAQAIRGIYGVTLWVAEHAPTERVLVDTLGFRGAREDGTTKRFVVGDGGPGRLVDVRAVGGFGLGAGGAGTVHHVAWQVTDDASQLAMRERIVTAGLHATPVLDRKYFRSVYFREPGGVLYELATTAPGFAVDEPIERLGEALMLPPKLEPRRSEIEAALPRIHLPVPGGKSAFEDAAGDRAAGERAAGESPAGEDTPGPEDVSGEALGFVHRYVAPAEGAERAGGTTLLLLHGTGGDEEDLLPLGRALLPGAGLLSPRGRVLERGAPRFFKRLAEGVFDQEDLARRSRELAAFVSAAAATYGLPPERIVAVGFSNGANIAASVVLRHPGTVRGAILLSPMLPFELESPPDLAGLPVFIGAGRADPIAPPEQVEQLADLLRRGGADVTVHWTTGGHGITKGEIDAAREWLTRHHFGG